jgi:hypothetical protein
MNLPDGRQVTHNPARLRHSGGEDDHSCVLVWAKNKKLCFDNNQRLKKH